MLTGVTSRSSAAGFETRSKDRSFVAIFRDTPILIRRIVRIRDGAVVAGTHVEIAADQPRCVDDFLRAAAADDIMLRERSGVGEIRCERRRS
jgi:hypothetical protein